MVNQSTRDIKKVLVVDDSKLARLTLGRLLKKKSITVLEADSVASALDVLRNEAVDAIFLDVQMPEQSGFDGLKILKKDPELKLIPCSMYSGDLSAEAQQEAIDKGAQAYLFKPANAESLDKVLAILTAESVADATQESAVVVQQNCVDASSLVVHKKAVLKLDGRTKNLARLLNQGRKETKVAVNVLTSRLSDVSEEIEVLKKKSAHAEHDDLLHRRAENDIHGQIQKNRENLRLAITVAIISVTLAVVSLMITGFIYFSYI